MRRARASDTFVAHSGREIAIDLSLSSGVCIVFHAQVRESIGQPLDTRSGGDRLGLWSEKGENDAPGASSEVRCGLVTDRGRKAVLAND